MMDDRDKLRARVEHDLTLHPPTAPYIGQAMDDLRAKAKEFALEVVDKCATSREQSIALTKVEEALFYPIAAVARYQPTVEEVKG